jgi:hypothetical protein
MGNSHKNLLLKNHWANCNQTFVERSLDGPLPKLCPVIPTSNQDGRQAKNRKKGDEIIPLEMYFFVDSLLLVTQIIKGKQLYYKM